MGSGTVCDDLDHDHEGEEDDHCGMDREEDAEVEGDNEEDYPCDTNDDRCSDVRDVHRHRRWGTGEGCAVSTIGE